MAGPVFCANSRLTIDTLTVSTAATGFPKENLSDGRPSTIYKPTGNPDPTQIKTDAGATNTVAVDYFGLINHNLGTQSVTITLAQSADDVTYNTLFQFTPTNDKIVFRTFPVEVNRFFRMNITNPTATIQMGQVAWGRRVEAPFAQARQFDPEEERLNVRINQSQDGNFLGSVVSFKERRARIKVPLITNAFLRQDSVGGFMEFWDNHASLLKPFFFSWNADTVFNDDAFFAVVDPRSRLRRPLRTQLDVGFRDLQIDVMGAKF